ncbi:MAG: SurA N-terminal domain-containing protein [Pseudomonadota bacterium]
MLDMLRGFSKGWLAKVLIGLLVASFAIWGISGSILFGGQYNVVQVGDTKVDVSQYRFAYENQLSSLSQSFGRYLTRQEADSLGLRESVLSQVVAGAVLDENARNMGLGISGDNLAKDISEDPTFRDLSGQFSRERLRSALRNAGLTEDDYIESRKRVSLRNQILDGTAASMSVPQAYVDAMKAYQNERRVFDYVSIGSEALAEMPVPSAADLKSYYDENKSSFVAPEYRKLAILKLEPSDLAKPEDVTEDEIFAAYENRKDSLRSPAKRQVQQLVLANKEAAETAEKQLAEGASFEEVVSENGKTIADIDLGLLTQSDLPDENIAKAAFEAKLNEPTDIVDGLFGPVILRVVKIEAAKTTPLDEIRDTLRDQVAQERAIDDIFASFDAVEDERGAGEQVLPIGENLGLDTRTISAMDANGLDKDGNPIANFPELRNLATNAFQAEPGDDTQAIEIGENGFLWFDVLEIIPERQKPFEEVESEVKTAWITTETDKAVAAIAEDIAKRVQNKEDFNTVLSETLPTDSLGQAVTFATTEPLTRNAQDANFPTSAVAAGFSENANATSNITGAEGQHIVFRVAKVDNGGGGALPEDLKERVDLAASQDILSQVVEHLQSRESVSVNRSAIDLAFAPHGGN